MNPVEPKGTSLDPMEVRVLLLEQAEQVTIHGDYAPAAISGARRIRTRRIVTAAVAGALALAVPVGLAARDDGVKRGLPTQTVPAIRQSLTTAPAAHIVEIRPGGAPEGEIPLPYIQAGVLHLGGRQIPVAVGPKDSLKFMATLSNGGVVYQLAGPNPDLPDLDAGPVTFLGPDGQIVGKHDLTHVDITGAGDIVAGVEPSGARVAVGANGVVLGRFDTATPTAPLAPRLASSLGNHLAVQLIGPEPYLWLGDIATGHSFVLAENPAASEYKSLAVHERGSLVVIGKWGINTGNECKMLINFRTGQHLRSWCDKERAPLGFFPNGEWMFGAYEHRPGLWVERADDGARLLDLEAGSADVAGMFGAPTSDGASLLVAIITTDDNTVAASCQVTTGECHAVGDGKPTPVRQFAIPENW